MRHWSTSVLSLAVVVSLLPVPAAAQDGDKYYFLIGMGPQWRETATDTSGATSYDQGFSLNGTVGYRFDRIRMEFEGAYFYNEADTLNINDPATGNPTVELEADGYIDVTAFAANVYYDISLGDSRFKPYVGVGVGSYKASVRGLTNAILQTVPLAITADSGWTTAWQARVGTDITLNDELDLLIGYRYIDGSEMDIVTPMGQTIHPSLELSNVELGIRYNF